MRGYFGRLGDLVLLAIGIAFPLAFVVIIPLWCYEGVVSFRELYYKRQMDGFLRNELRAMTPQQIEEKRIAYITILQSPYSTHYEKAVARYVIHYIEEYCNRN